MNVLHIIFTGMVAFLTAGAPNTMVLPQVGAHTVTAITKLDGTHPTIAGHNAYLVVNIDDVAANSQSLFLTRKKVTAVIGEVRTITEFGVMPLKGVEIAVENLGSGTLSVNHTIPIDSATGKPLEQPNDTEPLAERRSRYWVPSLHDATGQMYSVKPEYLPGQAPPTDDPHPDKVAALMRFTQGLFSTAFVPSKVWDFVRASDGKVMFTRAIAQQQELQLDVPGPLVITLRKLGADSVPSTRIEFKPNRSVYVLVGNTVRGAFGKPLPGCILNCLATLTPTSMHFMT